MRKVTCAKNTLVVLLVVSFSTLLYTQERFLAEPLEVPGSDVLSAYFFDYQLVSLPSQLIHDYTHSGVYDLDMKWFLPGGEVWDLNLVPAPLKANAFRLKTIVGRDTRMEPGNWTEVNTFRASATNQDIRLTVKEHMIYGYYNDSRTEWYIEPAIRFLPGAPLNAYLVYRATDVIPMTNLKCGQTERSRMSGQVGAGRGGCVEIELAVAADYSMYAHYGSAGGVLAQIEGVLNNVAGNYDDDFSSHIEFILAELVVSACENCDPWYDGQESLDLLESFRDWSMEGGFETSYDIGQFWSRRNFQNQGSGSIVGLAYVGTLCGNNAFQILEDFTGSAGYLRVLTAHEIGHNFGCSHNYTSDELECYTTGRPDFIMDPTVSLSNTWSAGLFEDCEANSVNRVNNFLGSNDCLSFCTDPCLPVDGLIASIDPNEPAIAMEWEAAYADSWRVLLKQMETGKVDSFFTNTPSLLLSTEIDLCSDYKVSVAAVCGTSFGSPQVLMITTQADSEMFIKDMKIKNCDVDVHTYSLDVEVAYNTAYEDGFTVYVGELAFPQTYTESPQQITITGLLADGRQHLPLRVSSNSNSSNACAASLIFHAPDQVCTLILEEDFNDCLLPMGWSSMTTYESGAHWQVADSTRLAANFGGGQNTINGNCMLYFDDDVLGPNAAHTGTSSIYTAVHDLEGYEEIELSLNYNFNAYYTQPHTQFTIDVFDGQQWVNLLTDQISSGCLPSQAWNLDCMTSYLADLSSYANAAFQIRFSYVDGDQWAEFVALDDFRLRAVKAASQLPIEWGTFSAKVDGENVRLDWTTLQEQDNSGFFVERSADGRAFTPHHFVAGAGYSNQASAYFYLDTNPLPGTSYYRLRQEDTDGSFSYSEVREVKFDRPVDDWTVYPNPIGMDGRLQVQWLQNGGTTNFDLFAVSGQLVKSYDWEGAPGWQTMEIDLSELAPGVYFLRPEHGSVKRVVR